MLERIHSLSYPQVFLFSWCLAMMRSHTMYWIGRGIIAGAARTQRVLLLGSPVYACAQVRSTCWGILVVLVPFLTVGIQSVVQLSTGAVRMPLCRCVTAVAAGTVAWTAVYTVIGIATLTTWLTGPVGRLICPLMLAALALIAIIHRSRVMRAGCGSGRREYV